eukprot:PhF_6_TR4816/c2_g1_i2/m.6655
MNGVPNHLLLGCYLVSLVQGDESSQSSAPALPIDLLQRCFELFISPFRFIPFDQVPPHLSTSQYQIPTSTLYFRHPYDIIDTPSSKSVKTSNREGDRMLFIEPFIEVASSKTNLPVVIRVSNVFSYDYTQMYSLMLHRKGFTVPEPVAMSIRPSSRDGGVVDWVIDVDRGVTYLQSVGGSGSTFLHSLLWHRPLGPGDLLIPAVYVYEG